MREGKLNEKESAEGSVRRTYNTKDDSVNQDFDEGQDFATGGRLLTNLAPDHI